MANMHVKCEVWENQRHYLVKWSDSMLPGERYERFLCALCTRVCVTTDVWRVVVTDSGHWSDRSGQFALTRGAVKLPSKEWVWLGDWVIDKSGDVDEHGWQYAGTWAGFDEPRSGGHRCVQGVAVAGAWCASP